MRIQSVRTVRIRLFLAKLFNPNRSIRQKLTTLKKLLLDTMHKLTKLRLVIKPTPPSHSGWGMSTNHVLPWDISTDAIGRQFLKSETDLLNLINQDKFVMNWGLVKPGYEKPSVSKYLKEARWRNYYIYWSAKLATRFTHAPSHNFVETGVWYGVSAYFAISAVESELTKDNDFRIFLYDAWSGMKAENLTASEMRNNGEYSYLSLEQTKNNLQEHVQQCEFIKGVIPEVFNKNPGPNEVSWLHIDLNSSMPTLKTLEQFVPKLLPGGVVLLDDYGWHSWSETREVADEFFSNDDGLLMPLPTGQAIFFKR